MQHTQQPKRQANGRNMFGASVGHPAARHNASHTPTHLGFHALCFDEHRLLCLPLLLGFFGSHACVIRPLRLKGTLGSALH